MKKVFSAFFTFYFSLASLMPLTDFSQFGRLYDAVKHSKEHIRAAREMGKEYSIFTFFIDHFVTPDQHDHPDKSKHDQLPLKVIDFHSIKISHQESMVLDLPEDELPLYVQTAFYSSLSSIDLIKGLDRPPRPLI